MKCERQAKEAPSSAGEPALRRLTVTNRWRREKEIPEIRMVGKWLRSAGFTGGCRLAIVVTPGRLELTVAEPPPAARGRIERRR